MLALSLILFLPVFPSHLPLITFISCNRTNSWVYEDFYSPFCDFVIQGAPIHTDCKNVVCLKSNGAEQSCQTTLRHNLGRSVSK